MAQIDKVCAEVISDWTVMAGVKEESGKASWRAWDSSWGCKARWGLQMRRRVGIQGRENHAGRPEKDYLVNSDTKLHQGWYGIVSSFHSLSKWNSV